MIRNATRWAVVAALGMMAGPGRAGAEPITLYNTGVANDGSLLAVGAVDAHYAVDAGSGPVVANQTVHPNTATAQYITSQPPGGNGEANTTFTQTFTIGADAIPATAAITGFVSADDAAIIYLNGQRIAGSYDGINPGGFGYGPTTFTITSGFQVGANTLAFYDINSGGGFGGLLVDNLSGSYATATSVPEPSSLVLCGIAGLAGLAVAKARRKRATA